MTIREREMTITDLNYQSPEMSRESRPASSRSLEVMILALPPSNELF